MTQIASESPALPRLVLRIGFAGSRGLPADTRQLSDRLGQVFAAIAGRLTEIAPGTRPDGPASAPHIANFYSVERPLLRLVTGLCEGADAMAAQSLEQLAKNGSPESKIGTELAAVLPFDLPVYRSTRIPEHLPEFDRLASQCSYILELDGRYEKPTPDTPSAKALRSRAYRAQSTLLVRQVDVLVALADPNASGGAGGTMETVRAALQFELPVVFVHMGTTEVSLIEPGDDPASAFAVLAEGEERWREELQTWVTTIVADPDVNASLATRQGAGRSQGSALSHGEKLLEEFFKDGSPETSRRIDRRERWWAFFESRFRAGAAPRPDPTLEPYTKWRSRATALNYRYVGRYRGTFFANYVLAAAAVAFAAMSLLLLGHAHPGSKPLHTKAAQGVAMLAEQVSSPSREDAPQVPRESTEKNHQLLLWLLLLGGVKLLCVGRIWSNTHAANHGDWNDRAVDYRYLAERLRTMLYLPRIGSFQPPMAAPPQFASRVVRQSAVDWLVDAVVRSIPPASLAAMQTRPAYPGADYQVTSLKLEPLALLRDIRERWIAEQAIYHDRNARTMERIHNWAKGWGQFLNTLVLALVVMDIAIIFLLLVAARLPPWAAYLARFTPLLVFFAAILPAIVASLNGIRFQSECRRLAERSAVIRTILGGRLQNPDSPPRPGSSFIRNLLPWMVRRDSVEVADPSGSKLAGADRLINRITLARSSPATDPQSWTPEVLRFAESVADVFVQEVAEWSVLYAKEVAEP